MDLAESKQRLIGAPPKPHSALAAII